MINEDNKLIWIHDHPEYAWYPGNVINKTHNELLVQDDKQRVFKIQREVALEVHPSCLETTPDLLSLGDFNEGSLLHNVRQRYKHDFIYTSVGPHIIISVNPYKHLNIYDKKQIKLYKDYCSTLKSGKITSIPEPHLYHIAENSYQALITEHKNQSIIISGESGAGKTEAAKILLRYITQVSGCKTEQKIQKHDISNESAIEDRILDSNPILEAFGNAKTVRNDNSSRFGKFIQVYIDNFGRIQCANIVNYLLEKSRIITHQPGERNYHIFYQICHGFDKQEKAKYHISNVEDYKYLINRHDSISGGGRIDINHMNDENEYKETKKCFIVLGFTQEEKDDLFKILSAILHLGNLNFMSYVENNNEGSKTSEESMNDLEIAAKFLGIPMNTLEKIFCARQIQVGKDIAWKAYNVHEAEKNKDAFVKEIYGKIFDWLIYRVNQSIYKSSKSTNHQQSKLVLGILDIFGFENFEVNSFEQLCINYTNEKLQQHFNNHIFKTEQEEYLSEGIEWKNVYYIDNIMTINLIEKSGLSIFGLLEDECIIPKGNDNNFHSKIYTKLLYHYPISLVQKSKYKSDVFGIKHYAGEVYYNCTNFVNKNKDNLNPEIINMLSNSQNTILNFIFNNGHENSNISIKQGINNESKKFNETSMKTATLTSKFKQQLNDLMSALNETNPAYVRCIKPNSHKKPGIFDSIEVQRQLRCAGMLEAIKIRKNGFSIRRTHQEFLDKYGSILGKKGKLKGYDDCKRLIDKMMVNPEFKPLMDKEKGLWALGKTKIFLKESLFIQLDAALYNSFKQFIIRIQRNYRKYIFKMKLKKLLNLMRIVLAYKRVLFRGFMVKIIEYQKIKMGKKIWQYWKMSKIKAKMMNILEQLRMKNFNDNPNVIITLEKESIVNQSHYIQHQSQDMQQQQQLQQQQQQHYSQRSSLSLMNSTKDTLREDDIGGYFKKGQKMAATEKEHVINIIAKLKLEIEEKRKENEELTQRLSTLMPRKTNDHLEDIMQGLSNHYGRNSSPMELENDKNEKKIRDLENKICEYRKRELEKNNNISLLKSKLEYMEKNLETYKNENKYLYEELESKKKLYDEKLESEIQIKILEEKLNRMQGKMSLYLEEVSAYTEKIKPLEEKVKILENLKQENEFKYEELKIKYDILHQSEDFFKKEALRMEQELNEKVDFIRKNEMYTQELQSKLHDVSFHQIDQDLLRDMEDSKISIRNSVYPEKIEELQMIIEAKNMKISNLKKENQISKEINQTLIKLLKVKTILADYAKAAVTNNSKIITSNGQENIKPTVTGNGQGNVNNNEINIEKFKLEEKKLLKILGVLMQKLEAKEESSQ